MAVSCMAIPRWTLPFDVVMNIMKLSSPASVASIMETCHFLYSHGPKHLLRDGVILFTPRQITSFASFMSAEGTARFRHLRELNLEMGGLEYHLFIVNDYSIAADALIQLLGCPALALHTLRLGRAEELLSSSRVIRDAFRTLATLQHLTVCDVGPATVATISKMSSKFVSATIHNVDPALDFMLTSGQVLATLAPFSHTLEKVSLMLDGYFTAPTDVCFRRVRILTVLSDSCRFLPACLPAFPNVQVLQHNPSMKPQHSIICDSNIETFIECITAARQWNTDFRLSALTECSSDLLTLCVLSPALVPVRKLRISTQVHDVIALVLFPDVLTATQPSKLEMCVAGLDTLLGVVSLLVAHALETLRTLQIYFSFGQQDYGSDGSDRSLAVALERLAVIIHGLPSEVPSFDLILDLGSCFGWGASLLEDEEVGAFRDCLASPRTPASASCVRRIIPVRPVYVAEDEDEGTETETECDGSDVDLDGWSDQAEWGSASYSDGEESEWSLDDEGRDGDEDEVERISPFVDEMI